MTYLPRFFQRMTKGTPGDEVEQFQVLQILEVSLLCRVKYHKFSALFCGFLNYPLSMSSDTISVMRHNNSCGKTLLDNWVEEVSYVTWAMLTSAVHV